MTHVVPRCKSGDLQRIDCSLVDQGVEVDRRVGRSLKQQVIAHRPMTYDILGVDAVAIKDKYDLHHIKICIKSTCYYLTGKIKANTELPRCPRPR